MGISHFWDYLGQLQEHFCSVRSTEAKEETQKIMSLMSIWHDIYKAKGICRNFCTVIIIIFSSLACKASALFPVNLKEDKTVVLHSRLHWKNQTHNGEVHRGRVAEGAIQKYYTWLKKQLEIVSKRHGDIMWNDWRGRENRWWAEKII